jgi:phosphonate transport system permease protein
MEKSLIGMKCWEENSMKCTEALKKCFKKLRTRSKKPCMNNTEALKRPAKTKKIVTAILIIAIILSSGYETGADFSKLISGMPQMGILIMEMFPPDWSYISVIVDPLKETLRMAILGTTIGGLIAIPLALFSASNITKTGIIRYPARFILNLIRTIPDLLFASIFVAIFGIGPVAGIMALAGFSIGIIAKLAYEAVETIDNGPLEAMTAVGANKIQWIYYAVLPQILPQFISYFLYTLEINVRAAAVLGLVGAGGIGLYLNRTLGLFRYDQTSVIIIATLLAVIIIDGLSTVLREKLL